MRRSLIFALGFILCSAIVTDNIYDISVPAINGGSQPLSAYQGKKILVITLPLIRNNNADSLLFSLDTLATAHASDLKVIAVPSYEDGYAPEDKEQLEQWYHSKLSATILLTDGMYSRKASGQLQHPLFQWLTDDTKNEHFDIDVSGPGFKFFINSSGLLYGVIRPESKIYGASVQKALQMQ